MTIPVSIEPPNTRQRSPGTVSCATPAARAGWQRRCLAFSLSDRDRREVLRNGLDEGAKRQAREDFKRLSRKT